MLHLVLTLFSNVGSCIHITFLPQGLCTCCSFCLELSAPAYLQSFPLTSFRPEFRCHLLKEPSVPPLILPYFASWQRSHPEISHSCLFNFHLSCWTSRSVATFILLTSYLQSPECGWHTVPIGLWLSDSSGLQTLCVGWTEGVVGTGVQQSQGQVNWKALFCPRGGPTISLFPPALVSFAPSKLDCGPESNQSGHQSSFVLSGWTLLPHGGPGRPHLDFYEQRQSLCLCHLPAVATPLPPPNSYPLEAFGLEDKKEGRYSLGSWKNEGEEIGGAH